MEKNFDFNKIGKRMPYTVPEGFFDEMERDIMQQAGIMRTEAPRRKRPLVRVIITAVTSVAAAAALFVVFSTGFKQEKPVGMTDVEQAFAQLSAEDQAYMLQVYQDDIFLNNNNQNINYNEKDN